MCETQTSNMVKEAIKLKNQAKIKVSPPHELLKLKQENEKLI